MDTKIDNFLDHLDHIESFKKAGFTFLHPWQADILFKYKKKSAQDENENEPQLPPRKRRSLLETISADQDPLFSEIMDIDPELVVTSPPHVFYRSPTSGGKSLVADILIANAVRKGRAGIVCLPFVALIIEKADLYKRLFPQWKIALGFQGSSLHPDGNWDIVVATPERAARLVAHWSTAPHFFWTLRDRFSIFVMDEFHSVGDPGRGAVVEALVTRLLAFEGLTAAMPGKSPQIVAMTATLSNHEQVERWLGSAGSIVLNYTATKRPSELKEAIVVGGWIASLDASRPGELEWSRLRTRCPKACLAAVADSDFLASRLAPDLHELRSSLMKFRFGGINRIFECWLKAVESGDGLNCSVQSAAMSSSSSPIESLVRLVWECVSRNEQVLVFCGTKAIVERVLKLLINSLPPVLGPGDAKEQLRLRAEMVTTARASSLRKSSFFQSTAGGKLHTLLEAAMPMGCAFHHSGLSSLERHIIEDGYRTGKLRVLTATSTLAAGVNLPADVVIFWGHSIAGQCLTQRQYKQMAGRAGRRRAGKSFMIVTVPEKNDKEVDRPAFTADLAKAVRETFRMANEQLPPISSQLSSRAEVVEELIGTAISVIEQVRHPRRPPLLESPKQLLAGVSFLLRHSFLHVTDDDNKPDVWTHLRNLVAFGALLPSRDHDLVLSAVGVATLRLCRPPLEVNLFLRDLRQTTHPLRLTPTRRGGHAAAVLQLIYISSPCDPLPPGPQLDGFKLTRGDAGELQVHRSDASPLDPVQGDWSVDFALIMREIQIGGLAIARCVRDDLKFELEPLRFLATRQGGRPVDARAFRTSVNSPFSVYRHRRLAFALRVLGVLEGRSTDEAIIPAFINSVETSAEMALELKFFAVAAALRGLAEAVQIYHPDSQEWRLDNLPQFNPRTAFLLHERMGIRDPGGLAATPVSRIVNFLRATSTEGDFIKTAHDARQSALSAVKRSLDQKRSLKQL